MNRSASWSCRAIDAALSSRRRPFFDSRAYRAQIMTCPPWVVPTWPPSRRPRDGLTLRLGERLTGVQSVDRPTARDLEVDARHVGLLVGGRAGRAAARGGETGTPLRRAARPLVWLSVEPHPPLARGWHRALASGPVAGSASYPLRSGCDVPMIVPRRGGAHQPQDLEEASDREHPAAVVSLSRMSRIGLKTLRAGSHVLCSGWGRHRVS